MKKSLIALAVMAAAGAASAQSSVTLFGIVDAAITHGRADNGARWTGMTSSGYNSSRLGFRGTEDLGGGMSASFWLEGQLFNDMGNRLATQKFDFARRSTVSLAGNWGELRLGRDYTPQFWNLTVFDPFGTNGVGTTLTLGGPLALTAGAGTVNGGNVVRADNQIGYFLPRNLGGFYGQIGYWFGEFDTTPGRPDPRGDGDGYGLRIGYGAGPFNVALAYGTTNDSAAGDYNVLNIGGSWNFGMARLMAQYTRDEVEGVLGGGDIDGRGWLLGALVPVGAGEIRAAYSDYRIDNNVFGLGDPRARKLALGYVHNLSKRTAVYTTVARVRNRNGANFTLGGATRPALGGSWDSTGFDLGVRHSF